MVGLRTVVLVNVLGVRMLAVPDMEPLGCSQRDLQIFVFLEQSEPSISVCEHEVWSAPGREDCNILRGS